ncbi:Lrp/AsnC family transcriptional regulator [Mycobacterium montefiorense]|uniref:Transcriptional regulator, AsnC family protein n=1 Tax=Mycobacterium montefiorense TaxID=154654 RepID=A0AA37PPW3_9MYCO|nr:Lrp/AsnC family transcriptional regulator [Mycobacterium montefiorense]MCV7426223.1 Lrp/AsnC family transcriptional regulator [Mycobacterium montefiorense]GBG39779.1 putative transcriptional regulator, AsnC family protein [Mycobacterium montefiorense]GKU35650.1 putative transcriptional regulator, AsnC family protein [Mycobacterium montefiorense]GKU40655.1 putative transcriptional regulator, AsnC family protein [Mycobacterium montefiorense]GKU45158.1 putative transcriptional regulator, AsnC 
MDAVDHEIIRHLSADGRLSNLELATRVGLSPSSCLRRVRNLEQDGVIRGYRAIINDDAFGRGFKVTAYVDLGPIESAAIQAFENAVVALPEIVECRRMMGTPDYVLLIAAADLADYEKLYADKLAALPGISRIRSQIAMKTVKSS